MPLELDKTFEQVIAYLVEQQSKIAEALSQQTQARPWMNFAGDTLKHCASKKAESELHEVFSRDDANAAYINARQNTEAKANEVAIAKIAGDFLAGCERDKRMQWRGRIRMFAHAAARCAGNGMDRGPIRKNTVDYLQRMFMKARAKDKKP